LGRKCYGSTIGSNPISAGSTPARPAMEDFRDRTLDRLVEFDERSRNFSAAVGLETYPFRSYTWACDPVLDQGREGACVGFAWAHELSARPKVIERDNAFA
jgi:hypothetical protein